MVRKKQSAYFDKKETRSIEERREDQAGELAAMMRLAVRKSPLIRKQVEALGIRPAKRNAYDILKMLPVISREKLVQLEIDNPPYAGLGNPDSVIDRIFTSPGPVYEPHLSESDPIWARAYRAAGFGPGDVVLNAFSYHLVAAGLTFHSGLRRVGATVVPSGASSTAIQVQLIRDLKVTGYTGTPSFLKAIIEKAAETGHDFKRDFLVRKASFAAEPLHPALREEFENRYGIDTYQMYGATEVGDVAYECREMVGADRFIETFQDTPIEVCETRDTKGLYAKARAGLVKGVTGIDDPYEAPLKPEVSLGTGTTPEENAGRVLGALVERGFLTE